MKYRLSLQTEKSVINDRFTIYFEFDNDDDALRSANVAADVMVV